MLNKEHRKDDRPDIEAVGRIAERPRRHRAKNLEETSQFSPI